MGFKLRQPTQEDNELGYIVLTRSTLESLVIAVNNRRNKGFKPLGGICTYVSSNIVRSSSNSGALMELTPNGMFCQAMIKEQVEGGF